MNKLIETYLKPNKNIKSKKRLNLYQPLFSLVVYNHIWSPDHLAVLPIPRIHWACQVWTPKDQKISLKGITIN